jgi:hypothetical protein
LKLKSKNVKRKKFGAHRAACSFFFYVLSFAFLLSAAWPTFGQDDDPAPPPLRMLAKDERISLEAQANVKARTQLAVDYMNTHLAAAEEQFSKHEFDAMFNELGGFHALVDNTLLYLTTGDKSNKKVLDNLKRFEIALRQFMPRLEAIHHELPFRYEDYVRKLIAYVRNARTKALDPLFSDTVVKQ